jgi:hypothetical protein
MLPLGIIGAFIYFNFFSLDTMSVWLTAWLVWIILDALCYSTLFCIWRHVCLPVLLVSRVELDKAKCKFAKFASNYSEIASGNRLASNELNKRFNGSRYQYISYRMALNMGTLYESQVIANSFFNILPAPREQTTFLVEKVGQNLTKIFMKNKVDIDVETNPQVYGSKFIDESSRYVSFPRYILSCASPSFLDFILSFLSSATLSGLILLHVWLFRLYYLYVILPYVTVFILFLLYYVTKKVIQCYRSISILPVSSAEEVEEFTFDDIYLTETKNTKSTPKKRNKASDMKVTRNINDLLLPSSKVNVEPNNLPVETKNGRQDDSEESRMLAIDKDSDIEMGKDYHKKHAVHNLKSTGKQNARANKDDLFIESVESDDHLSERELAPHQNADRLGNELKKQLQDYETRILELESKLNEYRNFENHVARLEMLTTLIEGKFGMIDSNKSATPTIPIPSPSKNTNDADSHWLQLAPKDIPSIPPPEEASDVHPTKDSTPPFEYPKRSNSTSSGNSTDAKAGGDSMNVIEEVDKFGRNNSNFDLADNHATNSDIVPTIEEKIVRTPTESPNLSRYKKKSLRESSIVKTSNLVQFMKSKGNSKRDGGDVESEESALPFKSPTGDSMNVGRDNSNFDLADNHATNSDIAPTIEEKIVRTPTESPNLSRHKKKSLRESSIVKTSNIVQFMKSKGNSKRDGGDVESEESVSETAVFSSPKQRKRQMSSILKILSSTKMFSKPKAPGDLIFDDVDAENVAGENLREEPKNADDLSQMSAMWNQISISKSDDAYDGRLDKVRESVHDESQLNSADNSNPSAKDNASTSVSLMRQNSNMNKRRELNANDIQNIQNNLGDLLGSISLRAHYHHTTNSSSDSDDSGQSFDSDSSNNSDN